MNDRAFYAMVYIAAIENMIGKPTLDLALTAARAAAFHAVDVRNEDVPEGNNQYKDRPGT